MKTYVLYHKNCFDGFCSAWVAKQALEDAIYIPIAYGEPVPEMEDGSTIYLLDFSFSRQILQQLNFSSKKLVVLDHHKTAQEACDGLDFCIFDMDRSGATLTWDYFFPGKLRPTIVAYTEDRDLWRFALPSSKEIFEYVASFPFDFAEWNTLAENLDTDVGFEQAVLEGKAILRYVNQKVEMACKDAFIGTLDGHDVPIVNVPYTMGSDCGHRLLELYPNAPFAAYYFVRGDGQQQWGLRGRDSNDFDVSTVAKKMGGGGHKKASGFEILVTKEMKA